MWRVFMNNSFLQNAAGFTHTDCRSGQYYFNYDEPIYFLKESFKIYINNLYMQCFLLEIVHDIEHTAVNSVDIYQSM